MYHLLSQAYQVKINRTHNNPRILVVVDPEVTVPSNTGILSSYMLLNFDIYKFHLAHLFRLSAVIL